jgi:hypothetical protein
MSVDSVDVNSIIKSARDAAFEKNFKEAVSLYSTIMDSPEMMERVDLKVKYAFCLEKTGKIFESIKYYQEVIDSYQDVRESEAIKTLETKVSVLRSLSNHRKATKKKTNMSLSNQMDEASTKEFSSFLALGTIDLHQEGASGGQKLAKALERNSSDVQPHLDYTAFLALETHDFEQPQATGEEDTLDLSKEGNQ